MARAYLSLGSNVDAASNLRLGLRELRKRFGKLEVSEVYENPPVGFEGDNFLNAVASLDTDLSPEAILGELQQIHAAAGRVPGQAKVTSRTLDIDLLLYDRLLADRPGLKLPRGDVLQYNFVLRPLAAMAPDYVHPVTGRTLADHWREFAASDANRHPLTRVHIETGNGAE